MSIVTHGLSGLLVTQGLGLAVYTFEIAPPRLEADGSVRHVVTITSSIEMSDPSAVAIQTPTDLNSAIMNATALLDAGSATREQVDAAYQALELLGYSSTAGQLMDQLAAVREAMDVHTHVST